MRFRFIGCGDAFGSGGRFNTCFHVTGEHVNFLIDCGASSLPAMKRSNIARDDIDLILITHFHGDHFAGLPFFLLDAQFSRRSHPLVVAGPQGIESRLTQVMEALFEHSSKTQQKFALSVVALDPEQTRQFGAVTVTPYPVVHGESGGPFLGFRVEAEGYTYDRAVKNHLSLKTLQAHLDKIRPRRLILTHMSDDMLSRLDTLAFTAAHDGMLVEL